MSAFDRSGPALPDSPVVLSVPHAGRAYPAALLAALRVPPAALVALEDRHVDAVANAARGVETLFVQRLPRAWIDLNRSEAERDPQVDRGAVTAGPSVSSPKLRGGLGLVPRQVAGAGPLWRRRFEAQEVDDRIVHAYRPYHVALAAALTAARARFGIAVLLDLHSMPPLAATMAARFVIGDRFGRSSGARFVARAEAALAASGHRVALNTPYAGAHILERHGDPSRNVHAIQLEIDRTLYLDPLLRGIGGDLGKVAKIVRAVIDALSDEAIDAAYPDAAE